MRINERLVLADPGRQRDILITDQFLLQLLYDLGGRELHKAPCSFTLDADVWAAIDAAREPGDTDEQAFKRALRATG